MYNQYIKFLNFNNEHIYTALVYVGDLEEFLLCSFSFVVTIVLKSAPSVLFILGTLNHY